MRWKLLPPASHLRKNSFLLVPVRLDILEESPNGRDDVLLQVEVVVRHVRMELRITIRKVIKVFILFLLVVFLLE